MESQDFNNVVETGGVWALPEAYQEFQPFAFSSPTRGVSDSQNCSSSSNCARNDTADNDLGKLNVLVIIRERNNKVRKGHTTLPEPGTSRLHVRDTLKNPILGIIGDMI